LDNLKAKTTYTNNASDLKIEIHAIHYQCDEYYKVTATISNKYNDIVYEIRKKYKLYTKNIKDWYEVTPR
jgi:hypothetical protein